MTTALFVPHGIASAILRLQCNSTLGALGLVALPHATVGLIISTIADNEAAPVVYTSAGSTIEAVSTLGTYAAPTATKCRFQEVDATNHKGLYEVHLADARLAVTGAKRLDICLSGALNLAQADFTVWLDTVAAVAVADAAVKALDLKRLAGRVEWVQTRLQAPPAPPKAEAS
jgi:hypothetical protein